MTRAVLVVFLSKGPEGLRRRLRMPRTWAQPGGITARLRPTVMTSFQMRRPTMPIPRPKVLLPPELGPAASRQCQRCCIVGPDLRLFSETAVASLMDQYEKGRGKGQQAQVGGGYPEDLAQAPPYPQALIHTSFFAPMETNPGLRQNDLYRLADTN